MTHLEGMEELKAAFAIWIQGSIELLPEFVSKMSQVKVAPLPPQTELDQWAAKATDQLIKEFPLTVNSDAPIILASALVAKGKWVVPFKEQNGDLTVSFSDLNKAAILRRAYDIYQSSHRCCKK